MHFWYKFVCIYSHFCPLHIYFLLAFLLLCGLRCGRNGGVEKTPWNDWRMTRCDEIWDVLRVALCPRQWPPAANAGQGWRLTSCSQRWTLAAPVFPALKHDFSAETHLTSASRDMQKYKSRSAMSLSECPSECHICDKPWDSQAFSVSWGCTAIAMNGSHSEQMRDCDSCRTVTRCGQGPDATQCLEHTWFSGYSEARELRGRSSVFNAEADGRRRRHPCSS